MSAQYPVTRQSLGRTFVVAGLVLGLAGLSQVAAVAWKFFGTAPVPADAVAGAGEDGPRVPPGRIDIERLVTEMPPPDEPALRVDDDPLGNEPVVVGPTGVRPVPIVPSVEPKPAPEVEPKPGPTLVARPLLQPRPTPVPLVALTPKVSPQFTELIEQGKLLRNSGDTAGALVKFREASALEPTNAQAIAEQAYTFEKMSLFDKAGEQWRRVLNLGESAGVLYSAAKSKLDMAMASTMRDVAPRTGNTRTAVPDGKLLGIGTTAMVNDPDPASARKFVLQVPILASGAEKVSVRDMKVFVLFYDMLNGRDLASTAANVSNRWESPPADWSEGNLETLEVTYDLPAENRGERRDFHGYIVRLYYRNQLQDTYAEPATLNQRFPADPTLSE
jgi:hypothetical protein